MGSRIIMRVELTEEAKRRLHETARRNGMTQVAVQSRLLEWFATQSDLIQAAVLGHYPREISGQIAELILKKLAGRKPAKK